MGRKYDSNIFLRKKFQFLLLSQLKVNMPVVSQIFLWWLQEQYRICSIKSNIVYILGPVGPKACHNYSNLPLQRESSAAFPTALCESCTFSTFLPVLSMVCSCFNLCYSPSLQQYLNRILILIVIRTKDFEHLFICLFAICISSFAFYVFVFKSPSYIMKLRYLSDVHFANIFSKTVACTFIFFQ